MDKSRPFNPSAEKNKLPIFEELSPMLASSSLILEIGSGTGQHAVFFCESLPKCIWQPSEISSSLDVLRKGVDGSGLPNLRSPIVLDVMDDNWHVDELDVIFSANTAHFMSWPSVFKMISGAYRTLKKDGIFCLYGPFHYEKKIVSEGNRRLDRWLGEQGKGLRIRSFEALVISAANQSLILRHDIEMPANNHLLVFQKTVVATTL